MRKILFALSFVMFGGFYANAQDHAIGVRFGAGNGFGTEVSYQMPLGANRLELDLGLNLGDNYSRIGLTGVYQWVMPINAFPQGFNWYAGVGASLGVWDHDNNVNSDNDGFALGATGQVGIEYNFNFPLQLSLDWRPNFWVLPGTDFDWNGIALGARFKF